MQNKPRWPWVLALIVCLLSLTACRAQRRPLKGPSSGAPAIPSVIFRGERQEPALDVFVKEAKTVKTLAFEEYIQGVVAAEMDPKWPLEALAAQAILARTFTLEKIARDGGVPARGAHASTDIEEFQAYDAARINDNVKKAVQLTRGKVVSHRGRFIRAWFHANSGGKTATAADGLAFTKEPTPYVVSVADPISLEAAPPEEKGWSAAFSKAEVRAALKELGKNSGDFNKAEVSEKTESGRAKTLRFGKVNVSAPEFRLAIGSTKLKSALIDSVEVEGDQVVFTGKGYGHGVGMSQWGAKGRAEQGATADEIIKAYFRDVEISQIWD